MTSNTDLSETARVILGAFALADAHTLSADTIAEMSRGALSVPVVAEVSTVGHGLRRMASRQ